VNAGEYLRLSAQGEGATLTCLLRVLGSRIAQVSSLGGTGGTATLAAYFEEAAKVELEIRRTEKSAAPAAIRAEIAAQRQATTSDIAEASAYRAFTSAKTPDELDAVIRSATDVGATELTAAAVLAEVRKLFGAGQYQAGLDLAETRLAFARGFSSPRFEAQLLYLAGLCEILLEHNAEAVRHFADALVLQRTANQPYEVSATLQNMAAAHLVLGQCSDSLHEAEEALALRRTQADLQHKAFSQLAVAKAHVCAGQAQAALDGYRAVIPLWRSLHDARNEAVAWNDIGIVLTSLGAFDEARAAHASALRLREASADDAGRAETLVNTGLLHLLTHDYSGALADYEKALAIPPSREYQRRLGYALEGKAEALFHLGRRTEVNALLRRSVEILQEVGDRSGEAFTWRMLGEYESSTADVERAVALAEAVGDRPSEAVSLTTLARLLYQAHDLDAARRNLERALPIIESTRADLSNPQLRVSFLSARRDAYELLLDVLTQPGARGERRDMDLEAFTASERAHARALLDEIGASPGSVGEVAGLGAIRSEALDSHTTLVEYFLGEERSWGWFVSQDAFERFDLPGRRVLEILIRRFRSSLTARDIRNPGESPDSRAMRLRNADAEMARTSLELSRVLLGPVADRIGSNRLLVVDDGSLRLAPFAALGVKSEIVLVPSASVLVQSRRASSSVRWNPTLLILADPVFGAADPRVQRCTRATPATAEPVPSFPRLVQSRKEADAIASMVPGNRVEERLGFDASPSALRAAAGSGFGAIHIAAHAVLDSRRPEMSGIVLSLVDPGGAPERGILRLSRNL
jgi:tetratricopeptide (TPR) repeat protein